MKTLQERFDEKWTPEPNTGCWLWTGGVTKGYGTIRKPGGTRGQNISAHRASWMLYRGPIPEGAHVLHRCDVPSCVNPEHLFLGDQDANMKDATQKGRNVYPIKQGEVNAEAKLTEEQVIHMRRLRQQRFTLLELTKLFGVGMSQASRIVRYQSWSHV